MEGSIKGRILKRNMKFWGKNAETMIGVLLMFVLFYGVVFSAMSSESSFIDTVMGYGSMCGLMFGYLIPISYGGSYLSLAIGFGSGRREAVWGTQFMNLLFGIQIVVIFAIGFAAKGGFADYGAGLAVVFAESLVMALALGQLSSAVHLKFGAKGYVIALVISISLMVAAGIACGISGIFGNLAVSFLGNITGYLVAGAIVAVILYGVSVIVLMRVVDHYEVHR